MTTFPENSVRISVDIYVRKPIKNLFCRLLLRPLFVSTRAVGTLNLI